MLGNIDDVVAPIARPAGRGLLELVVTDFGTDDAIVLNKRYQVGQTITDGLYGADGDFIDSDGNVYVSDYGGLNVQEYAPGSSSPLFTYSSGLADPIDVTTDSKGDVYVNGYSADNVVEFPQGSNTPSATCPTGLGNEGVAVDSAGDVFVSGNNSNGTGNIVEFKKGLKGCKAATLGATLEVAGGLQIDAKGDLVACDQDQGVDIIPKPDASTGDVLVDTFPSGTPITTLGNAQGIEIAAGVASFPFQEATNKHSQSQGHARNGASFLCR